MAITNKITREAQRKSTSSFIKDHYAGLDQKIIRPRIKFDHSMSRQGWIISLVVVVIVLGGAGVWFNLESRRQALKATDGQSQEVAGGWFAVKLLDGEFVYGKIDNLKTDPIVINPVYYNYDQVKDGADKSQKINEAGDLRLVKRGQETHGPDGALEVFKSQFVYMERLRAESKVLQAILQNEK